MAAHDVTEGLEGATIGSIRLVERLGEGGMGEVYVGIDERLGRRVAVKVIHPERRLDPGARARFRREARILSQLERPHICRLYDLVEDREIEYLVLELVQGRGLRQLMEEGLSRAEKTRIADQIAAALVAAHAMSVVHRDLKPDNIMVGPDGLLKVLDFGLARTLVPEEPDAAAREPTEVAATELDPAAVGTVTQLGDVMGTPRYMSPEQARGEQATAASDVYSFGLILLELFTGRPPFGDEDDPATLRHRAQWGEIEPAVGMDPSLAQLIDDLTAVRPQARPGAEAVGARLRRVWDRPRRRLRRLVVAAATAVLVVATVVSSIGFIQARRAQARAEASERAALAAQTEAEPMLRESLALRRRRLGDKHPETGESQLALAALLRRERRFEEAERLAREVVEMRRQTRGEDHPDTRAAAGLLIAMLIDLERLDEAEQLTRETSEEQRAAVGENHPAALSTASLLVDVLFRQGRYDECEDLLTEVVARSERVFGKDHPKTLDATP